MTDRRLKYLEKILLEYRLLLLGQIEEAKKSLKLSSPGKPRDSGDRILKSNVSNLLLSRSHLQSRQLRSVEEALDRIKRGTYGRCHDCGKLIGDSRLTLVPWARLCLRCQRQEEEQDCFLSEVARRTYRAVDCGATEI